MENNIITLEQLQIILGVKENTVRALIRENDLPQSAFLKKGRKILFRLDVLLKWFESTEARICQC